MRKLIHFSLLICFFRCLPVWGSLSGNVQWSVWTTGSDTNAGGFDPSISGFATNLSCTSANTASPVCTSASYNFVSGNVGAWLFVKAGTNYTPGWCPIASVAANAATLNAAVGACSLFNTSTLTIYGTNTVAGIATTGSPTGGTWGVDYSQQASPQYAYSDLVIAVTTTNVTSVLHPFGQDCTGNTVNVISGTGFTAGVYTCSSVSGITATMDRSVGSAASAAGVANLGGALTTICSSWSGGCTAGAYRGLQAGNTIWVQSGTYPPCNTALVSVNCYQNTNSAGSNAGAYLTGYATARGDNGAKPILSTTANEIQLFNVLSWLELQNIELKMSSTGTAYNPLNAQSGNVHLTLFNVIIDISGSSGGQGMVTAFTNGVVIWDTKIICNSTGIGIMDNGGENNGSALWIGKGTYVSGCLYGLWDNNGGSATALAWYVDGAIFANNSRHIYAQSAVDLLTISRSSFYNATNEAVRSNTSSGVCVLNTDNNIFYGGTYGLYLGQGCTANANIANAYGNLSTANTNTATINPPFTADVQLSAIPWVNAGSGNFLLNSTAGGGALLKAAGWPGASLGGTGYLDIGALQSQSLGGSAPHAYVQ